MSTKGVIGIQGLKTSGNELAFPPGTLTQADNCMLPAPGVIQPRRGQKYSSLLVDADAGDGNTNRAQELWQWLTHLFVSYTGDAGYGLTLFENLSTYHALGAFAPPEPSVMRMKFAALAQSAYFTTSAGLYGIDKPGNAVLAAGVQRPQDFVQPDDTGSNGSRITGNPNAIGSWLSTNNAVAYRAVVGRKDSNGVVKLSEPNGRCVIINPADLTMVVGKVILAGGTVTVTMAAGQTHGFRVGDIVNLTLTGGDIGNLTATNRTLLTVTSTTFTYADPKPNYTNVASVVFTSGFKQVQLQINIYADPLTFVVAAQAGWFVQVYRTDESGGASIDPGDECFQCLEHTLTASEVFAGVVSLLMDTTPSSFLGAPLPTNSNTGDGPDAGGNDKPPLLRDVCTWDSKLFGIQKYDRHRLTLRVLGCGAPGGLQPGDIIAVNTRVFEDFASATGGSGYALYTTDLPSVNILRTCQSLSRYLGYTLPGCATRFEYDGTSPTGEILIDEVGLGSTFADSAGGALNAIYAATSRTTAFADRLATLKTITNANTQRTGGNTVTVRCSSHGFSQGDLVMIAYQPNVGIDPNFAPGLKTVASVVDANNFTYAETGSNATLAVGFQYYAYATTFKSDAGVECVRFSKDGEPDAWPLPFTLGGLPDGASPLRIKPTATGNALMVFLKNGDVFRVSGQYPYVVRRFDGTATLVAADSLVEHNSQLHCLTTQGAASVSDGGVGLTGRDVEDDLRALVLQLETGTIPAAEVWGLSYESDRQYQLWTPAPDAQSDVGYASQTFVLGSIDAAWAKFASVNRRCGLVWRGGDYLIMGEPETNTLRVERKQFGSLLWASFADEQFSRSAVGDQTNVSTIHLASVDDIEVGDGFGPDTRFFLVTAVDAVGKNVTINGTISVVDGKSIAIFKGIPVELSFAMDAAGIPGIEKMFRELQLHFKERLFSRLTVSFTNEKSDTPVTVTVTPDDYVAGFVGTPSPITRLTTIRVDVPNDLRRSALLKVQVTLQEAFSYFRLLGYSATSEASTERTGK